MTVIKDTAFPIWADRSTKPVGALIGMDQNLFWNKEIPLTKFQDPLQRNMWNNETLKAILEQWHIAQIPQAEWDAKKLNITAKEGWHNVGALFLFMQTTIAKGSQIGGAWQQAIVDDLLKPLTSLMDGGYIPKVDIYLMASWEWYQVYAVDEYWKPASRVANKQIAGLGLTRVWGKAATGLMTEVPMGTPYNTLAEVWQNVPGDGYVYPLTLDGIDFKFFVFSFNRLLAKNAFYAGATLTPITCGMWCDTAANMGFGAIVVEPPPVVTPPTDPTVESRLKALEDKDVAMQAEIDALKGASSNFNLTGNADFIALKALADKIDVYLKGVPKY